MFSDLCSSCTAKCSIYTPPHPFSKLLISSDLSSNLVYQCNEPTPTHLSYKWILIRPIKVYGNTDVIGCLTACLSMTTTRYIRDTDSYLFHSDDCGTPPSAVCTNSNCALLYCWGDTSHYRLWFFIFSYVLSGLWSLESFLQLLCVLMFLLSPCASRGFHCHLNHPSSNSPWLLYSSTCHALPSASWAEHCTALCCVT